MSYLLDTNVLSELLRRKPNPAVVAWFESVPDDSLHVSVLTFGEIRKGVESSASVARKEKLRIWLEHTLADWFENRLLAINQGVAERWGRLLAEVGRPVPAINSLLAATALHHHLRMVTRNTKDFAFPDLQIVNPWK